MKEKLQKRFKELQKKDKKGFTLIELIVVLVILGIILAITIPAVTSYIGDAQDAKYLAQARSVFVVAEVERAKAVAAGEVAEDAVWPTADGSVDSTVAKKSGIKVSDVKFDGTKYTFKITDGSTTKDVQVTGNDKIEVK